MNNGASRDVALVYDALRRNMLADQLDSISYHRVSERGEHYYMIMPWDYIRKRGIRIMLMFFICIFACYNVLTISTPPLFLISAMKFSEFCKYVKVFNISVKKLRILLCVWIVICAVLNIVIWNYLERIWGI